MESLVIINVVSKWHVYGAESYLRYILNNNIYKIKKVFIFIQFHDKSGKYRVSKNDFVYLNLQKDMNVYFFFVKNQKVQYKFLSIYNKRDLEKFILIMISAKNLNVRQLLSTCKFRNRKYILIDEGMGSYYSAKLWNLEIQSLKPKTKIQQLENVIKDEIRKFLCLLICRDVTVNNLLIHKKNTFKLNEMVSINYREYFSQISTNSLKLPIENGDVVFVSDNLELMLNDEEEEMNVYKIIYNEIRKRFQNKRIWIKPHPNEIADKKDQIFLNIGFDIIECNSSYEEICSQYDVITCGIGSTTLLTTATIFRKPAFSFFLLLKNINEYGRMKRKEFLNIIREIPGIEIIIP